MERNKISEFILLTTGVILTRLGDVIGTYYYTSDLSYEANPMVILFHTGWTSLIIAQITGIIFSAGINYISLFRIKQREKAPMGLSFKQYISTLYFDQSVQWKWSYLLLKKPSGKNQTLYMYGWLIPRILICVGLVLILFFFFLDLVPGYRETHKYFVVPMYILMFSSIPLCQYLYLRFRFNKYSNRN